MNKHVLIIDDDAAVRESMRKVLGAAGYEVSTAADGEEALVGVALDEFDVVLLDLNLPVRSGWDIFERMTTRHPCLPIIVITGMPDQYRTAVAAGVGALMEKPIEADVLLHTIEELLAEPEETRLRRLCGYGAIARFLPPEDTAAGVPPVSSKIPRGRRGPRPIVRPKSR